MFPAKILVATDGSDESIPAMEAAVELATGTGSELHVVHVVSTVPELPYPRATDRGRTEAFLEQRRLGGLRLLEHQVGRMKDLGGSVESSHYREGDPKEEVIKLSKELDVGLIVTGGHRRPWFERIFGAGFSTTVLRKADRPVLVVGKQSLQSQTIPK